MTLLRPPDLVTPTPIGVANRTGFYPLADCVEVVLAFESARRRD
ncbi:hypothetical protein [Kutzneria sp. 744]|nr:hypothetical protein [Kutzneria sp. 744]